MLMNLGEQLRVAIRPTRNTLHRNVKQIYIPSIVFPPRPVESTAHTGLAGSWLAPLRFRPLLESEDGFEHLRFRCGFSPFNHAVARRHAPWNCLG